MPQQSVQQAHHRHGSVVTHKPDDVAFRHDACKSSFPIDDGRSGNMTFVQKSDDLKHAVAFVHAQGRGVHDVRRRDRMQDAVPRDPIRMLVQFPKILHGNVQIGTDFLHTSGDVFRRKRDGVPGRQADLSVHTFPPARVRHAL